MNPIHEIPLTAEEGQAIARGLWAIAACDGVHERERALITSFFAEVGEGAQALASLEREETITPKWLAAQLSGVEARGLFIKTAFLLAWADGEKSAAECAVLEKFATALGITPTQLIDVESEVKEYLLSHLTHLHNTEGLATVAKSMDI